MCGINGLIHKDGASVCVEAIARMRDTLSHRGPDSAGLWLDKNIGFGHRRLSILDVSENGNQPIVSVDGRYIIVFNGEIYNFKELRSNLWGKGYTFYSDGDTEVLLYLYIEYGKKMLDMLNGMFAFAIWDTMEKKLFAARDRVGVKPFYYYNSESIFAFASEPKAFFSIGIEKKIAEAHLNEWLLFRYVAGENTLLGNVKSLLPGYYLELRASDKYTLQTKRWWHFGEKVLAHPKINSPAEWFEHTFFSSINYRMISDVPVGILLSGGLDSSSIATAISMSGFKNINTFNVGFNGFKDDESNIARQTAENLQMPFHCINVPNNNIYELFTRTTQTHDEPLIHQNDPHLFAIANYAKQFVKVLQSGEGGDELLGGYIRYQSLNYLHQQPFIRLILSLIPNRYKTNRLTKLESYYNLKSKDDLLLYNASNYYKSDYLAYGIEAFDITGHYRYDIVREAESIYPQNVFRQALYLDLHTHLCSLNQRNDRATMGASIECREPFQDYRLIEGIGSLDNKWFLKNQKGKWLLRKVMGPHLPAKVSSLRKIGFSIPWNKIVESSLELNDLWNRLPELDIFKIGILKLLNISEIKRDYERGDKSKESLLRHLTMLAIWNEVYLNESHGSKTI